MSDIAIGGRPGSVTTFNPRQTAIEQARLNAIIDYAIKLKDWPLVVEAIDAKIEDQVEFVGWWRSNVQPHGTNRYNVEISALKSLISVEEAFKQTDITPVQVSRWSKKHEQKDIYREQLINAARRRAGLEPAENHLAEGTGDNEWFTPAQYIAAARIVMGTINLDPASHKKAQETVQAKNFYTQQDDGLKHEWHGAVWLNPPYSKGSIGPFVEKLVGEVAAKRTTQAIMLTHNSTDTEWFHLAESRADLLCFTHGRIKFLDIHGQECSPTQGQTFFYFGRAKEEFRDIFGTYGFVR
jgi:phage N-6-adenine-methyltransferase